MKICGDFLDMADSNRGRQQPIYRTTKIVNRYAVGERDRRYLSIGVHSGVRTARGFNVYRVSLNTTNNFFQKALNRG